MEKKIITEEMIKAAADYTTYAFKEAWCADTAPKCFDRLAITAGDDPMPPMYMVNEGLKKRYLMTILVSGYLRQPYENDAKDEALISEADYDAWEGSHVFGQLDRFKKNKELCDKCYDLLYDFRELNKRLSAQIGGLLAAQNDSVMRQSLLMANQIKELPQVMEQLKELQERVKPDDETTV